MLRQASRLPSGEKRGDTSGPAPRGQLPLLRLSTSMAQRSKFLLMLKRTDSRSSVRLAWTTSVLPSGDHCGSPYQTSSLVSRSILLAANCCRACRRGGRPRPGRGRSRCSPRPGRARTIVDVVVDLLRACAGPCRRRRRRRAAAVGREGEAAIEAVVEHPAVGLVRPGQRDGRAARRGDEPESVAGSDSGGHGRRLLPALGPRSRGEEGDPLPSGEKITGARASGSPGSGASVLSRGRRPAGEALGSDLADRRTSGGRRRRPCRRGQGR